jgi:mRNA-degrading endonuclease toxin of MazEF toxin-antitoxin module
MQTNSSSFEQGDIVILDIPFSSFKDSKLRPALVVSSRKFNQDSPDIVVLKVTGSFFKTKWELELDQKDLERGRLKKKSYIDAGFLLTVEKRLVKKKVGSITTEKLEEVLKTVGSILNI